MQTSKSKVRSQKLKYKVQLQTRRPKSSFRLISIRSINEKFREIPEPTNSIENLLNEKLQIKMLTSKSKVRSQKSKYKVQVQTRRPKSSFRLISIRSMNEKFREVPERRTSMGNLLNEKLQIESKKPSPKSKTEVPSFNLSLNYK